MKTKIIIELLYNKIIDNMEGVRFYRTSKDCITINNNKRCREEFDSFMDIMNDSNGFNPDNVYKWLEKNGFEKALHLHDVTSFEVVVKDIYNF